MYHAPVYKPVCAIVAKGKIRFTGTDSATQERLLYICQIRSFHYRGLHGYAGTHHSISSPEYITVIQTGIVSTKCIQQVIRENASSLPINHQLFGGFIRLAG